MEMISLRGPGLWGGRSTRHVTDRGGFFQIRIVNGRVSSDGSQIISMPGFRTVLDLTEVNNANGYRREVYDSVLPVLQLDASPGNGNAGGNAYYNYGGSSPANHLTLTCSADELHIHGFEQVRDTLVLFGESGHRKIPIYNASRVQVTLTGISVSSAGFFEVYLSGDTTGGYTSSDASTGQHGLEVGDWVWIEDLQITANTLTQAYVDEWVNGRFHRIRSRDTDSAVLQTSPAGITANQALHVGTGSIYRTRNSASGTISTPNPTTPYEPNPYLRVDDLPALTTWTVRDGLRLSAPASTKCVPAWVANRQRDHGDGNAPTAGTISIADPVPYFDGVLLPSRATFGGYGTPANGGTVAYSRRRQKSLPFRLNPEPAGDRLILAAPGYSCCFQVPLMIPIEPEAWPSPPGTWSPGGGRGIRWFGNDIYDKPRCLGVPKAIMVDSLVKAAVSPVGTGVPSPGNYPHNFLTVPSASPTDGLIAGEYQIAVSYVDEVTGEEGLASEPVKITLPTNYVADIRLLVVHPGYVMSESLCLRLNIYVATPGTTALGFYMSVPLKRNTLAGVEEAQSAKYGFKGGVSPDVGDFYSLFQLPTVASPMSAAIDTTRLAPQSGLMPRGAESARMIRGQLFTVGHSGTHGGEKELLRSMMSADFHRTELAFGCSSPDEVQVRGVRSQMVTQATPSSPSASTFVDGPFGLAQPFFPSAYQGIDAYSVSLLRAPHSRVTLDIIKNNAGYSADVTFPVPLNQSGTRDLMLAQRIRTLNAIRDLQGAVHSLKRGEEVHLLLPRGQIQVGDPGRPGAVNATAIQFLDSKKDDDGIAIGEISGAAVICSKKETHLLQWGRTPRGTVPSILSTEHGCIATNSMVSFDGGLAWIGARGPMAMSAGSGVSWIGDQIEADFHGDETRYAKDSKGLMRHCFGAHDEARGCVYWGLVTSDSTHQVSYKGVSATFANSSDEAKSRFPCNEILVWSYRANAFSTWVPPSGLEVLWMRQLKLADGSTRMCFLAADKRIYAFDEAWSDTNADPFVAVTTTRTSGSTSLVSATTFSTDHTSGGGANARAVGGLLRAGMPVAFIDSENKVVSTTTVSSVNASVSDTTITLTDSSAWGIADQVEIGYRPTLLIECAYVGQTTDVLQVNGLHMRYNLIGDGKAHCRVQATVTDLNTTAPVVVGMTESPRWMPLVAGTLSTSSFERIGQRRIFEEGKPEGSEIGFQIEVMGRAGISIAEIAAEVEA